MIAVTGAAGFIGSNIVWELNRRGRDDLVVVDVAATADGAVNLAPLRYARYMDKDTFRAWIAEPANARTIETLYHLGAVSYTHLTLPTITE